MKKKSIGVVVARFETPYLHPGHLYLLNTVEDKSDELCVVLGMHIGIPTDVYPLDIPTRRAMVHQTFPEAIVLELEDISSNEVWSERLDKMLIKRFDQADVILYGSRNSFLESYTGNLPKVLLEKVESPSGTDIRGMKCTIPLDTEDFRRGAIYTSMTRLPIVYPTVDVVPYRFVDNKIEILVGEKLSDGGKYSFIGGFADPKDDSFENTARRELAEEAGQIRVYNPEYVGSYYIRDYRYLASKDSVITTLFVVQYMGGEVAAGDDMDELHWIPLSKVHLEIVEIHKFQANGVFNFLTKKFSHILNLL